MSDEGIGRTHLFGGSASAARTALSRDVGVLRQCRRVGDAALREGRYLKGWLQERRGNTGEESPGIRMLDAMEGYVRDFRGCGRPLSAPGTPSALQLKLCMTCV